MCRYWRDRPAPRAPLELHAPDVLAAAWGDTLVLWPDGTPGRVLSRAVTRVDHVPALAGAGGVGQATPVDSYDTVVSIGQLGSAAELGRLVHDIRALLRPTSVLLFCEPTAAEGPGAPGSPNDVTGALWRGGLTVFECRRYRAHHRLRTYEYCWGRARPTPTDVS